MRAAVLAAIVVLLVGGCTSVPDAGAATLPPSSRVALTRLFRAAAAKQGFRISRAALQDPTQPGYGSDPHGTHLAIYLEPTGSMTPQEYAERVMPTARIFLPKVFRRWKGLQSFDVCLEPAPEVDNSPEPPPVTQIYVERPGAEAVDWSTLSLAELQGLQRHDVALYLSDPVLAEANAGR